MPLPKRTWWVANTLLLPSRLRKLDASYFCPSVQWNHTTFAFLIPLFSHKLYLLLYIFWVLPFLCSGSHVNMSPRSLSNFLSWEGWGTRCQWKFASWLIAFALLFTEIICQQKLFTKMLFVWIKSQRLLKCSREVS